MRFEQITEIKNRNKVTIIQKVLANRLLLHIPFRFRKKTNQNRLMIRKLNFLTP